METRLEEAAEAWGAPWSAGDAYDKQIGQALEPVTGAAMREVLRRQGNGKAKGADGWSPRELAFPANVQHFEQRPPLRPPHAECRTPVRLGPMGKMYQMAV